MTFQGYVKKGLSMLLTKGASFKLPSISDVSIILDAPNQTPVVSHIYILDKSGNALESKSVPLNGVIQIGLDTLHKKAHNVSVVISANEALSLQNAQLEIYVNQFHACKYILNEKITTETAFVLGEFYRFGKGWKFRAVGHGYYGGLNSISRNFGISV